MCQNILFRLLLLFSISSTFCLANLFSGCEITIRSGVDNSTGEVTTPGFHEDGVYPPNTQCLFKFIGQKDERVKIDFLKFMVRGVMPECINDYVDIWIEVGSESASLIDSPLFGRYCGVDHLAGPYTTVSLTNMYVLAFFADDQYEAKGLNIQYEFISAAPFKMGKPAPTNVCGWTMEKGKRGKKEKKGEIMTPNYPGMYPSALFCFYKFKGRSNDRIRLDFEHFDLYGDDTILRKPKHCPYDNIRIYDGFTNEAPVIGTYCWKSQPFSVFSSGRHLLVEFESKVGHDLMNFGFKASYVISDKLINLNFIEKSPTTSHVLGTECDQRVMSAGESKGTLTSPNFPRPFPVGVKCHYFVDGLENREDLEVSVLSFAALDIPAVGDSKCSNASVNVYVKQETVAPTSSAFLVTKVSHSLVPRGSPDYKFCGVDEPPNQIVGVVPRTTLIFDSINAQGKMKAAKGFKAHYEFIKRYGVPGTQAPTSACDFKFNSGADGSGSDGTFHSPRHPARYPSGLDCVYHFLKAPGERVFIAFSAFAVESNAVKSARAGGRCVDDVVEVKNVFAGGAETLVGAFCGGTNLTDMPGPMASDPRATKLKLRFRSNAEKDDDGDGADTGSGFAASYSFAQDRLGDNADCGGEMGGSAGGTIVMSEYGPAKYCQWRIKARRGGRVLLTFNSYSIEGSGTLGCRQAVLRVFKDASQSSNSLPRQICGKFGLRSQEEGIVEETDFAVKEIISDGSTMNVEFVSFQTAAGDKGFKIGWAEIRQGNNCPSSYFRCKKSSHCIPRQLVCDRTAHCGADPSSTSGAPAEDASDELENCQHQWPLPTPPAEAATLAGAAASLRIRPPIFVFVIALCLRILDFRY